MSISVHIKWGKREFDVVAKRGADSAGLVLKQTVEGLTGVRAAKQRLLAPGIGQISDADTLSKLPERGATLMLIGTAEEEFESDARKAKELAEAQKAAEEARLRAASSLEGPHGKCIDPCGLVNLGNTCYANSVVQALAVVDDLQGSVPHNEGSILSREFSSIMKRIASPAVSGHSEVTRAPLAPLSFIGAVRSEFPQFAAMSSGGEDEDAVKPPPGFKVPEQPKSHAGHGHSHGPSYMQQDAEEFFTALLSKVMPEDSGAELASLEGQSELPSSMRQSLNSSVFDFVTSSKKSEKSEKGSVSGSSTASGSPSVFSMNRVLRCSMGSQLSAVNYLHEGIAVYLGLNAKKSGNSSQPSDSSAGDGTTSQGSSESGSPETRLETLPKFFVVQMMRFSWKASSASAGTKAGKTKIVRRVVFPKTMDVYDYCSNSLKSSLDEPRKAYMAKKLGSKPKGGEVTPPPAEGVSADSSSASQPGPNGMYDLVSIVSHLGRSSEGGHYVCWRKTGEKELAQLQGASKDLKKPSADQLDDKWLLLDDDEITETSWKYVVDHSGLAGGVADSQIAYLLVYKRSD